MSLSIDRSHPAYKLWRESMTAREWADCFLDHFDLELPIEQVELWFALMLDTGLEEGVSSW